MHPAEAVEFAENMVLHSTETARRFREEIMSGCRAHRHGGDAADPAAGELSRPPETGCPYRRPTVILTGRQDSATGYADVYPLLEHYPRGRSRFWIGPVTTFRSNSPGCSTAS